MTQTLFTYQIPDFDKTSTLEVKTTVTPNSQTFTDSQKFAESQKFTEKLRRARCCKQQRFAIANLERQDIGWLDILRAMANIAEQWGEDRVGEGLAAAAGELKRNRKVIRDL